LAVGKKHPARIAALVAHTETEVWVPGMGRKVTTVLPDLLVSLSADSPVDTEEVFDYTVTVENRGPSDAKDVEVKLEELPTGGGTLFRWEEILKGESVSKTHLAKAPAASGTLTARAYLVNPAQCGNTAEVTTAVTDGNGVALAVTLAADAQAVAVGDKLTYTIKVVNQGPGASPEIVIEDQLPESDLPDGEGVRFDGVKPLGSCNESNGKVTCKLTPTADGGYPQVTITVVVEPVSSAARAPLKNTASVSAAPFDPDPTDSKDVSIETPILPFRLLLPFFEVGESSKEVTTLVAVRNSTNSQVGVEYDFLNDPVNLLPHVMNTRNLRDEAGFAGTTGYVAISPVPREASLGGDFIRVDPTPGTASGGLLVSATEMCREWSARFLNGGPLEAGTDFLFFAPGNSAGPPVAIGRAFNEKGQYLQELTITNTEESFRIRSQDLKLLANFGSIEWTFREGLVGHVSAVHREKGKDEVAVPGHCRRGAVTPALILPFFEAAPGNTLYAIRNEGEKSVKATVSGIPFDLAGHETRTFSLEGTGSSVKVDLDPPSDVSGDFLLIGPGQSRAGGALVRPSQLCHCWDVRFLNGSQMLFYVEGRGTATAKVYTEDGGEVFPPIPTVEAPGIFRFSAPPGKGAIEWDLGKDAKGYAAALLTGQGKEGDYSVLVPGICRPCPHP
ncbi:MAG TPA: DUF11 domain-containing protein, partial [Thermoanaerobaculia bacterium]|nr:DUF11 domain-containing protein [Thermoanaerobaculia bacterium]